MRPYVLKIFELDQLVFQLCVDCIYSQHPLFTYAAIIVSGLSLVGTIEM